MLTHDDILEITNLPQEATVCSYCGISYLIHHEIKRLEQELKESQKRLATILLHVKYMYNATPLKQTPLGPKILYFIVRCH